MRLWLPRKGRWVELGGSAVPAESVDAVPGHPGIYTVRVLVPAAISTGDVVPVAVHVSGSDGRQYDSNVATAAIEAVR